MKFSLLALLPLVVALPTDLESRQAQKSVNDAFVRRGKQFFGTATDQGLLQREKNAAVIKANFGQVTAENSWKWGSLEPQKGSYNWGGADFLANWATQNNKKIRGHTLIWHSQLPSYVQNINNADTLRQTIRTHVSTVVGRYKGKVAQWDVVNEILAEDGKLRDSVFSRLLGNNYEFVKIAFEEARKADPNAKLYINDYNLDTANYGKVKGMVSLVNTLRSQGVPIDGIGSQTHLDAGKGSAVQGALQQLASSSAPEVAITELDIANAPSSDYNAVVQACLNVSKCKSITVWGVSDKDSWRGGKNPLLFDSNFSPKAAYNSIVSLLG